MTRDDFLKRYGPWAVVAGGSEGLGEAFAEEIARRGVNLVLIARRADLLKETAAKVRERFGVQVRALALDLAERDSLAKLQKETGDLEVGLLVCNAAVAYTGLFLEAEPSLYQRMIDVNCRAHLGLIHWLGGKMADRGRGGIVVMSSMAGFQGSPLVGVYGATKAFLINLSEALWKELKPRGVNVTVCCAAAVKTPHYLAGRPAGKASAIESEPSDVAREAIAALGRKPVVVPGAMGRIAHFIMGRLLPRKSAVSMMGRNTRALYED